MKALIRGLPAVLLAAAVAHVSAAPPSENVDAVRKAIEERYALAAKALTSSDYKAFSSLKARGFQCRVADVSASRARPSRVPTVSAAFLMGDLSLQGGYAVVDNVETLDQKAADPGNPVRSEIRRRDTWVKLEGAWKLLQTEMLGSVRVKPAAPTLVGRTTPFTLEDLADPQASNETIARQCHNEIGILCHSVRGDIAATKKCLSVYETSWLDPCRAAMADSARMEGRP